MTENVRREVEKKGGKEECKMKEGEWDEIKQSETTENTVCLLPPSSGR
jgi:hypothetical protein